MTDLDWSRSLDIVNKSMIMKTNMLDKGLVRAKAKCPYCDGYWHGVLCGRKKHLHMACDGECKAQMME